ncbi:PQQ-like domain-containing protein [Natronorubrum sediminis]|uniref:PQQ-like domain-containing protein n=1 Tax=Natronorubrum sediminis TaxID=640943 RepID=A0A1H6FT35_9EURY|nr:PQQ-binding-like beta-propeller repeat protein [Natronorubrum sediminis]SEH13298.1 PQQ-like domain-containing protein [Natronorubrum sediminis]
MANQTRRSVLQYAGVTLTLGSLATGATAANDVATAESSASEEADGWSSLGGNAGNNSVVPASSAPEEPVDVAWEYDHGGPVAVDDGTVFVVADGAVHALDAADGSLEWETEDVGASGAPAVTPDSVHVGGEQLTKVDRTDGGVCCQADLGPDEVIPSPTIADGLVIVVAEGALYAVDVQDHEMEWYVEPSEPLYEQPVAVADGAVFATSESKAYALELDDGSRRWIDDEPEGDDEYSRFPEPGANQPNHPVATDGVVAIGSADSEDGSIYREGHVTLYDTETGRKREHNERGAFMPALVTDDAFYAFDAYNVTGYDRESGSEVWDTEVNTYRVPSIAVGDGIVYAGLAVDGEAYGPDEVPEPSDGVYAFDEETGEIEWAVGTDEIPTIALADETIYASSETLVAIRNEDDDRSEEPDEEEEEENDDGDGGETDDDESEDESSDGDSESDDSDGDDGDSSSSSDDGSSDEGDDDASGSDDDDTERDDADSDASGSDESDDADDSDSDDIGAGDDADDTGDDGDDSDDGDGADDSVPGFTAGAGAVGGLATLEWLRRKAGDAEEPAE